MLHPFRTALIGVHYGGSRRDWLVAVSASPAGIVDKARVVATRDYVNAAVPGSAVIERLRTPGTVTDYVLIDPANASAVAVAEQLTSDPDAIYYTEEYDIAAADAITARLESMTPEDRVGMADALGFDLDWYGYTRWGLPVAA